jgi:hypothetical protein
MWKAFWFGGGAMACLFGGLFWISANSTFLFEHPRDKSARIVIDHQTGAAVVAGRKQPFDGTATTTGQVPRAEVPRREFDFGMMSPLTEAFHDFSIRNAGSAPLKLQVGPTTCKCTLSALAREELPPGEQTTVRLQWNSGRHFHFEHSGTIITNDPQQQSIELRIRGQVITQIGTDVDEIVIPALAPDTPATSDVLVYSQVWDRFEIKAVQCSLAGVTWKIDPFDPERAEELQAKTVQRVRLAIPGDLPDGDFAGVVRISAAETGRHDEHRLELPLHGTVLRRMTLVGGKVDPHGNIDLGSLPEGKGTRVRLLVKVRDREPYLDRAKVTVFPEFLVARLRPHAEGQGHGLYDLELELPATAPSGQFRGNPRGEVRIDTGHPRLGNVKLGVTFAILPRPSP